MAEESKNLEDNARFMDQYSRQIGAYGMETMAKLVRLDVLIVGLRGVGIETAKNLILAGPRSVTLFDPEPVEIRDLGSNFYLREEHVGQSRAQSCVSSLKELNKMVNVVAIDEINEEVVGAHGVCVFTNSTKAQLLKWNHFCRTFKKTVPHPRGGTHQVDAPIGFIYSDVRGAMGYAFTDFGDNFTVRDANGENNVVRVIQNISTDENGVITLLLPPEGRMHNMPTGDEHAGWCEISGVEGMMARDDATRARFGNSINESGPWPVRETKKTVKRTRTVNGEKKQVDVQVMDSYRLTIGDTRCFTPYEGGGIMTQVKQPTVRHFRSLASRILAPGNKWEGMLFTDGTKFGRGEQLHIAMQGVFDFQAEHGRLPAVNSDEDTEAVVALAVRFNETCKAVAAAAGADTATPVEEVDVDVVRKVARYAAVELQPLCAYFGGVVAQEIVKVCGKFTPLDQYLYIDAFEVLPDERPQDTAALGCRYDDQIAVFGKAFQDRLGDLRTFMVGCGALGCEFLKNFALMGLACGDNGKITVTDNDRIEVSNLNRQFLFREHNVKQPKSTAAAAAVAAMNSNIKVDAREILVHQGTEDTFNDSFWEEQNFITNALDNVKARNYVDGRCVFYEKPLLESGTLGTKCNVQVILPHKTRSYTDIKDGDDEDHIPMCTLRNFPSLIEHCIEWSRARFTDYFVAAPNQAKKLVEDRDGFLAEVIAQCIDEPNAGKRNSSIATELPVLRSVKALLQTANGVTFEDCVKMAHDFFYKDFHDNIRQLVHQYPIDATTAEGEKFWTGAKRFPNFEPLDLDNEAHMLYITCCANLLAVSFGLVPLPEVELLPVEHEYRNPVTIRNILADVPPPVWTPSLGRQASASETEEDKEGEAGAAELAALVEELRALDVGNVHLEPADFEKDEDANFHIDFITAAANMRASNYRITQAPRHKVKLIAGKIIPAIATTTAAVCGMVMMELYKIIQDKPLEAFRDSSNSLGINGFFFSEPPEAIKAVDEYDHVEMEEVKCRPQGFTKWDKTRIDASPDITVAQFLEAFKTATGLKCTLLFHRVSEVDGPARGLMLYDANAWNANLKALYSSKLDAPLVDWVRERYEGADVIPEGRRYVALEVGCCDEEDHPFKVPSVVLKWA